MHGGDRAAVYGEFRRRYEDRWTCASARMPRGTGGKARGSPLTQVGPRSALGTICREPSPAPPRATRGCDTILVGGDSPAYPEPIGRQNMTDSPSSQPDESGSLVARWPLFPDTPVQPANVFTFAYSVTTDECEMTVGRVPLPVGATTDSPMPDVIPVQVVARFVLTRTTLAALIESAAEVEKLLHEQEMGQ